MCKLIQRNCRLNTTTDAWGRIIHWVQCVVTEAYSVLDFEETEVPIPSKPFGLGIAVLNIWARFFLANTQWNFVVAVGEGLQKYTQMLQDVRSVGLPEMILPPAG